MVYNRYEKSLALKIPSDVMKSRTFFFLPSSLNSISKHLPFIKFNIKASKYVFLALQATIICVIATCCHCRLLHINGFSIRCTIYKRFIGPDVYHPVTSGADGNP